MSSYLDLGLTEPGHPSALLVGPSEVIPISAVPLKSAVSVAAPGVRGNGMWRKG